MGCDLAKIKRDFKCNDIMKTLKNVTNLGSFTKKRNIDLSGIVKLKILVKVVLKEDLCKDDYVRLSN